MSALRQPPHRLSPGHWSHTWTLVPRGTSQGFHADGAILPHTQQNRELLTFYTSTRSGNESPVAGCSPRYLFWRTFYFLQVLLHHLLWCFTCVRGDETGAGLHVWTCSWMYRLKLVRNQRPTLTSLFLGGLSAAVAQTRHWFDVALADWRRVQHQFGRPGQAHGQSSGAHQDPCDT